MHDWKLGRITRTQKIIQSIYFWNPQCGFHTLTCLIDFRVWRFQHIEQGMLEVRTQSWKNKKVCFFSGNDKRSRWFSGRFCCLVKITNCLQTGSQVDRRIDRQINSQIDRARLAFLIQPAVLPPSLHKLNTMLTAWESQEHIKTW